jgi:DNA-binding transcriptional ArsR family regulator
MKSVVTKPAKQNREALEKIAHSFRALSEPTRLAILQELKSGPKTVNELVDAIGTSQPNVSKQLRILFDGGFVSKEQRGNFAHYQMQDDFVIRLCELVCNRLNQRARASIPHYTI